MQLHRAPRIPYAGGWDGASSFSRSICAGNYSFGATVSGEYVPVLATIIRSSGGDTRPVDQWQEQVPAWQAVTEVTIEWWAGNRHGKKTIPPGEVWASYQPTLHEVMQSVCRGIRPDIVEVMPREEESSCGTVDVLHRW